MLGKSWGNPMWSDDPVRRSNRKCWHTSQKTDSPSKGRLMVVGLDGGG